MGYRVHFGAQTFVVDRRGELVKSRYVPCRSAESARGYAERLVSSGSAVGATALSISTAGEFDDGASPIIFAAFGKVPDDDLDIIPF